MEINLLKLFKYWTEPEYKLHIQFKNYRKSYYKEHERPLVEELCSHVSQNVKRAYCSVEANSGGKAPEFYAVKGG